MSNQPNPFMSYGNMIGNTNNVYGTNKFRNKLMNQISNNGNSQGGFANGIANHRAQNKLSQQGAKLQNQNQAMLLQQQQEHNQRLQYVRMLQKQQQQLNKIQRNQLANTYIGNNKQTNPFTELNSNIRNTQRSNTFRKSDAQKNSLGNSIPNNYPLYDYDSDYYDFG